MFQKKIPQKQQVPNQTKRRNIIISPMSFSSSKQETKTNRQVKDKWEEWDVLQRWQRQTFSNLSTSSNRAKTPCLNSSHYTGNPCDYVLHCSDIICNCCMFQTNDTCVPCECASGRVFMRSMICSSTEPPMGDSSDITILRCGLQGVVVPKTVLQGHTTGRGWKERSRHFGHYQWPQGHILRSLWPSQARASHFQCMCLLSHHEYQIQAPVPCLAAVPATIVGSAIQFVLSAAKGSAMGADITQWRLW